MSFIQKIFSFVVLHKKVAIGALLFIVITGPLSLRFFGNNEEVVTDEFLAKEVRISSVSSLLEDSDPLPLLGTVSSESEVTLRAEAQGSIKAVYRKQGQFVGAGTIIAEIENSRERAAVLQAEAGVDAARASLSILQIQSGNAEDLLAEAKTSTVNTLFSVYSIADDVVRGKVDQFFSNPRGSNPQIIFPAVDSNLEGRLEWNRFLIEQALIAWGEEVRALSSDKDLTIPLSNADKHLRQIQIFLDDAALAINTVTSSSDLSQTTIDVWRASIVLARTSINGALSSVSSTKDNLNAKTAAVNIAKQQADSTNVSGEILQGEAVLKQARAGLSLAQSALEKTIIRAPISGTLNALSIERGDLVSLFQSVGVIANNSALKVVSYITEEDRAYIAVGGEAMISGSIEGVVAEIAPAINPETKKIEVTIIPRDANPPLVNGESVEVSLSRKNVTYTVTTTEWVIPITAVKVSAEGPLVYGITAENTITAIPVEVGPIIGKDILISSGLSAETEIVIDARGLREGETVVPIR